MHELGRQSSLLRFDFLFRFDSKKTLRDASNTCKATRFVAIVAALVAFECRLSELQVQRRTSNIANVDVFGFESKRAKRENQAQKGD